MAGVLMKRGHLHTDTDMHTGIMPCEDEDRDQGEAAEAKGH